MRHGQSEGTEPKTRGLPKAELKLKKENFERLLQKVVFRWRASLILLNKTLKMIKKNM